MRLSLITTAATYALRCPSRKRVPLKGVSLSFSLTLSLSLTVRCFIFRLPAHCLAPGAVEEIKKKKKGAIQDAEMLTHTAESLCGIWNPVVQGVWEVMTIPQNISLSS